MAVNPERYPGTSTFVNKLGLTDAKALAVAEADLSWERTLEYLDNPPEPTFDLPHLQAIHRHLFQDVYD